MNNTEQLIDKLTNAVSYRFREDKTAPGIVTSRLKKGYYCSVVRYDGPFARDKKVVCNARGNDLPSALKELANKFLAMTVQPKDPVQELDDLVKKSG